MCKEVLVDQIICDEFFRISNYDKNIKIENITIPEKSTIDGTVDVAVLGCTPVINKGGNCICAEIELYIQKELLISTPDNCEIPLELGFRITKTVCFKNCSPCDLCEINPCFLNSPECRVINIVIIKDLVTLHPSTDTAAASFDELLKIGLHLMITQKSRLMVPVCPVERACPPKVICYPVPVSSQRSNSNSRCFSCLSCSNTESRNSRRFP